MTLKDLDAPNQGLKELAATIRTEHQAVGLAGRNMLEHAFRAGDALHAAKNQVSDGGWEKWTRENCPDVSFRCIQVYMQLSAARPQIEAQAQHAAPHSLRAALKLIGPHRKNPRTGRSRNTVNKTKPATSFDALGWWFGVSLDERRHLLDGAGQTSVREAEPPAWRDKAEAEEADPLEGDHSGHRRQPGGDDRRNDDAALGLLDKHVGSRVRMRRMMLAMSQENLGDALGLTFQQVQQYEKGINCIGAGRLQQISRILRVPVAFFFEDAPGSLDGDRAHEHDAEIASLERKIAELEAAPPTTEALARITFAEFLAIMPPAWMPDLEAHAAGETVSAAAEARIQARHFGSQNILLRSRIRELEARERPFVWSEELERRLPPKLWKKYQPAIKAICRALDSAEPHTGPILDLPAVRTADSGATKH